MGVFLSWVPDAGPGRTLFFDVTLEASQEFTSTPTEYPVEEGLSVTDHIKREPNRVSIEVFVSNAPIYDFNGKGGAFRPVKLEFKKYQAPLQATPGSVFGAIGGAVKGAVSSLLGGQKEYYANVLQWDTEFDAVSDTQRVLEEIRDKSQLVKVITSSRVHESMCLIKFTVHRNADTGTGATIRLDFQEIRQVEVKLVNSPKPTEVRAKPDNVSKGAQAPAEVKGPQKSVLKSAGQAIYDKAKPYLPASLGGTS